MFDYRAKEDDELTLVKGSHITVISKDWDDGWWTGCCDGKTGVFPSDYVTQSTNRTVSSSKGSIPVIKYADIDLKECIGTGGFGRVCRAVYKSEEVAVKEAHLDDSSLDAIRDMVLREATLCWMFKHPNIIKLKGICLEPPHFCLIMEYARGGSLGRLLNARKFHLPPLILIQWALQVAHGMQYLHDINIIHRDLK